MRVRLVRVLKSPDSRFLEWKKPQAHFDSMLGDLFRDQNCKGIRTTAPDLSLCANTVPRVHTWQFNLRRNDMMKQISVLQRSKRFTSLLLVVAVGIGISLPRAFGVTDAGPSSTNSESRQLDYWLGDWTITGPGASASATSKVYLTLDKCMIVESWDGGRGHKGENMFAYSSDDKSWHGMFADNQGRVHEFVGGKVASGSAEFSGPSRAATIRTEDSMRLVGQRPPELDNFLLPGIHR
jgi:hypothetical protein